MSAYQRLPGLAQGSIGSSATRTGSRPNVLMVAVVARVLRQYHPVQDQVRAQGTSASHTGWGPPRRELSVPSDLRLGGRGRRRAGDRGQPGVRRRDPAVQHRRPFLHLQSGEQPLCAADPSSSRTTALTSAHTNARDRSTVEHELALRPELSARARMPPTVRPAPRGERPRLLVLTAGRCRTSMGVTPPTRWPRPI